MCFPIVTVDVLKITSVIPASLKLLKLYERGLYTLFMGIVAQLEMLNLRPTRV